MDQRVNGMEENMKGGSSQYSNTNEKILKAALKVVDQATISGTRMHLIAEEAEMVQSNVHYYYKTKEDLLEGLQEYVLDGFYTLQDTLRKKSGDTLEEQLHVFFQHKKQVIIEKRDYDFAGLDFIVQSKINPTIQGRFQRFYMEWRDSIREILIRFCPDMDEKEKRSIPYMAVSLLEGASIQILVDNKDFDVDGYFEMAEEIILGHIKNAADRKESKNEQEV